MFAVSSVSTILIWILIMIFMYLFPSDSFDFVIQTSIFLVHSISGSGVRCCKTLLYPESLNPLTWKLKPKMITPQTSNLKVIGFGILDMNEYLTTS